MPEASDRSFVRSILVGAAIGALGGLLIGLAVYALVGSGSLAVYEIVAGSSGLVLGIVLGAFYGGAVALPGRRGRDL